MSTTGQERDDGAGEAAVDLVGAFAPERVGAVRAALAELGVEDERIHVSEDDDERTSLRAEQVEEVNRSVVAPQAGVAIPKEAAKSLGWTLPTAGGLGAAAGALVALIPLGSMDLTTRLIWFAVIGVVAGTVVAFVVTGAMATKDPFVSGAAQRGVVVRVQGADDRIAERLARLRPIRLDLVTVDGDVLRRLRTEEDDRPGGAIEELADNVERERQVRPTQRHR